MLDIQYQDHTWTIGEIDDEKNDDCLEVRAKEDAEIFESLLVQQKRATELKDIDIQEHEWEQVLNGKKKSSTTC